MIRIAFLLALCVSSLLAQLPGGILPSPQFPLRLKQFLELTDEQATSIFQLNASFQQFQFEKMRRASQVQAEIAQETARATLDPMALGLRYLELESLRREVREEQSRLETAIQNVLTPAQKTKLQTLRQALQLQPVICEAQAVNLLSQSSNLLQGGPAPFPGNIIPASRWFNTSSFLLGAPACGGTFTFGGPLPGLPSQP